MRYGSHVYKSQIEDTATLRLVPSAMVVPVTAKRIANINRAVLFQTNSVYHCVLVTKASAKQIVTGKPKRPRNKRKVMRVGPIY